MKQHPTEQEWMEFVYDELDAPRKRAIQQHISGCGDCQRRTAEFSETGAALDSWKVSLPARHRFARSWAPAFKWAAAAAVLVTTAFATSRWSRPEIDVAALQAQIAKPLQESLTRELNERFETQLLAARAEAEKTLNEALAKNQQQVEQLARTIATLREQDREAVYASLKELEAQQIAEYRRLRQNLETVAMLTDRSLKDAQRKLVQLATYTAPQGER